MSRSPWLIQLESGKYRCTPVRLEASSGDERWIEANDPDAAAAAMQEAGYGGEPVLLAVPSEGCLCAAVVLTSRRLVRNRQALAYALEEQLPLAAEEMVCDFVTQGTTALGVAVEPATLKPIVRSLETAGVAVTTVTPSALLILDQLRRRDCLPADGLVVLIRQDHCDCFVTAGQKPQQWRYLSVDPVSLRREVAVHLMAGDPARESPLPVTIAAVDRRAVEALERLEPDIQVQYVELAEDETLLSAASGVLVQAERPWIELRRDEIGTYDPYVLVGGSLRFLTAACLLAVLSLTAVTWIHAGRYESAVQAFNAERGAIFQRLFPEARVPVGIRSRLESEREKLLGLRSDNLEAPELESATPMLLRTLDAMPRDLRFRLLEMQFENATGYLEGEARRHGDADVIAASLRAQGLSVEPPRTERLSNEGVAFSLAIGFDTPDGQHE